MALTKKQEKQLNGEIKKTLEEVRFQGLKAGAAGILGAVLEMCNSGKTDEDNLGFTYDVLDKYIRTGEIEDGEVKKRIDMMHEKNLFKLQLMPSFQP